MLRRILIILLVAIVIIVAILAVQWFLNRNSDDASAPEDETTAVVDESGTAPDEGVVDESVVDEAPVSEGADSGDQITDASTDGQQPADSYPAPETEGGDAAPAEGGEAGTGDPNAGGGVPAEGGDAAPDLGDTVAMEPGDAGTGGIGAAFNVQPGVPTDHSVQNLEWLTQLARCYGTTVADIQAANSYPYPDLIYPGTTVHIANPGNAGSITINDTACFIYHTVQQGETLYSIANQYGIHYQWLARINAIYNYNYIYAGQLFVIPNPVDPVFTQPPTQPYYPYPCLYGDCWTYPPVPAPYN